MTELFASVATVATALVSTIASVTTAIIGNELFQIGFGIMVFSWALSKVLKLIKKGRK